MSNAERRSLIAVHIDLDGIHVGGHSWARISLRLPRWYAMRVEHKRTHRRYEYGVVSMNGAGAHGPLYAKAKLARKRAKLLAEQERSHERVKLGPYEIQRVEHVRPGSDWPRRYWMRERRWWCPVGRWVAWDCKRDETVRRPDWIYA